MTLQTLVVAGYTVSEAGPLEAARIVRLAAEYMSLVNEAKAKKDAATEEDFDRLQALAVWPQVAACVTPNISRDEWFQIPTATVLRELRQAAEQLNPTWFIEVVPGDVQKKTTRPRHKPTIKG